MKGDAMRVLIVEDDENKRHHLCAFLADVLPQATIVEARSYHSGLTAILKEAFALVLLDMSMPTFDIGVGEDGGRPQPLAGREVLRHMERKGVSCAVVVVTQLVRFGPDERVTAPQLDEELRRDHPGNYRGMVYYDATLSGWKDDLQGLLKRVADGAREQTVQQ